MGDNVELIESLWDAFGKGDLEKVTAAVADDAEIVFPESLPWGGTHRGPDGFRDALASLLSNFSKFEAKPEKILGADDNHVVVVVNTRGKSKAGRSLDGRIIWLFQLRDGRVTRGEAFPDTATVLEAIG